MLCGLQVAVLTELVSEASIDLTFPLHDQRPCFRVATWAICCVSNVTRATRVACDEMSRSCKGEGGCLVCQWGDNVTRDGSKGNLLFALRW